MAKPILYYQVRQQVNRSTGATILVPAIVEREQAVPLEEIIARAIDRGLIAGVKPSAAKQIAVAVASQMYEEFRQGRGVKFGNYFFTSTAPPTETERSLMRKTASMCAS